MSFDRPNIKSKILIETIVEHSALISAEEAKADCIESLQRGVGEVADEKMFKLLAVAGCVGESPYVD